MLYRHTLFLITIFSAASLFCRTLEYEEQSPSPTTKIIDLIFKKKDKDALLAEFLSFSTDSPDVIISSWKDEESPEMRFNPKFEKKQLMYRLPCRFTLKLQAQNDVETANLIVAYALSQDGSIHHELVPLRFASSKACTACTTLPAALQTIPKSPDPHAPRQQKKPSSFKAITTTISSFLNTVKDTVTSKLLLSDSSLLRAFLIFLLGLLMSLTPCIYPMIPITMGILQATNQKKHPSMARNFGLAASYTAGMSTTFALLGLLAVSLSVRFGELMGNPLIIILLIAFLAYMAFSLFGWYELHIPSWLKPKSNHARGGSYGSAYVFGILSGAFASPCLSPGLALVLSMVSSINSALHGFLLLFIFGIGTSFPLLLIGTFSNALTHMPRAGMWMVEIKKLFGYLLLAMCFYYLRLILPVYLVWWFFGIGAATVGTLYIARLDQFKTKKMRRFAAVFGVFGIFIGLLSLVQGYKTYVTSCFSKKGQSLWKTNYAEARAEAIREGKPLVLDFGAAWCSLCSAIEQMVLSHESVITVLSEKYVAVHIDCTSAHGEQCAALQKKFVSLGLPTISIIDPNDERIIASFGAELLDDAPEQLAQQLNTLGL